MVREVKKTVQAGNIENDIRTRRAKSGNMIREIPNKEKADNLADILRHRMGETLKIRRPSPSIPLIFIGIEDSVEPDELKSILTTFDERLNGMSNFTIRENKSGVRTAVIRVPPCTRNEAALGREDQDRLGNMQSQGTRGLSPKMCQM